VPTTDHQDALTLSVVIPTFGRLQQLPVVLAPLFADPVIDELIVVVDGSDDGSFEWLTGQARSEPRLRPVLRERSGGAQAARADGLVRAEGDVVLFLDDDVLAGPGLADGHRHHHRRRQGLVVVGFMPVALPEQRRAGQFASYLYAEEYMRRTEAYAEDSEEVLRTLWWGNVSMRRSDALAVGLVSPGIERLYHEDQDFGLRCLLWGLEGVFDRTLIAQHLHSRDIGAFIRDARSQGAGRAVVHQRHHEVMGDLHPEEFAAGVPFPADLVVRKSGNPRVAGFSTAVLRRAAEVAGRLGWYSLETTAGKVLRRVNQRSGAEVVWRGGVPASRTEAGHGPS
jgi:glycosyltransferase involved in cell wall biosynthesis